MKAPKSNERNRYRLGSTTTEILIVLLVMTVMVCFLIPPARRALVKSREISDVANIRAAHFRFQYLYMNNEIMTLPNSKTDAAEFISELLKDDGELNLYYVSTKRKKYGISHYFVPETKTYYITYTPQYINGGEAYEWDFAGEDVQFLKPLP